MKHYFLSSTAEQDIDEILSYIAKENPIAAFTLLDEVYEAMDMLASNPEVGYKRDYLSDHTVRFWPFKWHYLVVYKDTPPIEIVRVLSGYRDISNLLN